ncbi:MAG: V-type ATP synthase subunit F [Candidatus Bathyarchaeia archaeon]
MGVRAVAKVAVVAEPDVATAFRISGINRSHGVKDAKEAADLLYKLAEDTEVAIIIVTEKLAEEVKSVLDTLSKRVYPTIITVPGREGPAAEKVSPIMELVKRTIGVEIKI